MNNRMAKVTQLVHRELGEIIQKDLEFPGVIVCLNAVEVTPDLRHAKVHVGVVGSAAGQEAALKKLELKRVHLQKRLAGRVKLQFTPQLHFHHDQSIERGVRITNIMEEIDQQLKSSPTSPEEDPEVKA